MGAFLLSSLGLKVIGGIAALLVIFGLVAKHDSNIRTNEAAKWKPKVEECQTANKQIKDEHDAFVANLAAQAKAAQDAKARRLADLAKRSKDEQKRIDDARTVVASAPLPAVQACSAATDRLRALAIELREQ